MKVSQRTNVEWEMRQRSNSWFVGKTGEEPLQTKKSGVWNMGEINDWVSLWGDKECEVKDTVEGIFLGRSTKYPCNEKENKPEEEKRQTYKNGEGEVLREFHGW